MPSESPEYDVPRPTVFYCVIAAWLCLTALFLPRLLALLPYTGDKLGAAALLVFAACLSLFWFYGSYLFGMAVAGWLIRRRTNPTAAPSELPDPAPKVALLYTTRNDFREEACDALRAIDYPAAHVFILDDSTLAEFRRRVDDYRRLHAAGVTVIRRKRQTGFKAGNVNHAMKRLAGEYPLFVVCDADGILPADFLLRTVPVAAASPEAPFVQTRQVVDPDQRGVLPEDLGVSLEMHFRHLVRPRSVYGGVMFYGHGALLRTAAWKEEGGLPELVSEDLGFTLLQRARGKRGIYLDDVTCIEEFPQDFPRLRRRTGKWIQGTAECVRRTGLRFFASKRVPWFEKFDFAVHAGAHFLALPFTLFLVSGGILLPKRLPEFRYPYQLGPEGADWPTFFLVALLLTAVIGLLPTTLSHLGRPLRLVKFMVTGVFVQLSGVIPELVSLTAFMVTGNATFRATNDGALDSDLKGRHLVGLKHRLLHAAELICGCSLLYLTYHRSSPWLLAPAAALCLALATIFRMPAAATRALMLPPIIILLALVILALSP